jgi:CubicO group peptidase (beta-lactamase class C family)
MDDFLEDPRFADEAFLPSRPAAQGMDPAPLEAGLAAIERRALPLHGLLIVRRGRRVLERYGTDQGRQQTPADAHDLYSTTKTLTGTLIGRALADGSIPSLQTRAVEYFTSGEIERGAPAVDRIRIEDLLTMRSGLEHEEGREENERVLSSAACAAAKFLSRPMVAEPGQRWNYSTADSQILAEVLRRSTGRTPLEYARARIFGPLAIRHVEWRTDRSGTELGGTRLALRPRDLARFGWMLLSRGRWKDAQIVPSSWVEAATRQQVVATSGWTPGEGYGYHCWVPRLGGFATRGYMGQVMYVFPDRELLIVFTGALVPPERADSLLDDFVRTFILCAIR